ncbi:MAG: hypothetical protein N3B01_05540 [Verrucomicrobiae bacterium]|nr:hypothetical protein [Verrucomicrobiae bacterium]
MRGAVAATLVFVAVGWGTIPLQVGIEQHRLQLKFGGMPVTRQMRDVLGQGLVVAVLAGFRGLAADFVWIWSHTDWEQKRWFQQYNKMQVATLLQPRSVLFWDVGAWHMAWNIGYAERTDPSNATVAQGIKREMLWHQRAEQFLLRGIQNLPNRYELYFKLGWLYEQKFQDPCRAAEQYGLAARFADAPRYVARMHCRRLASCGRLTEAYQCWKRLWQQQTATPGERQIVERELRRLENEMDIPDSERIFPVRITQPEPSR